GAGLRPGVPPAVDSWNPPGWGRGGNARISPAVGRRRPAVGEYGRSLLEWEELPGYSRCDGATSLLVAPAFMHGTCLSRFLRAPGRTDRGCSAHATSPARPRGEGRLAPRRSEERRVGKECRSRWWACH